MAYVGGAIAQTGSGTSLTCNLSGVGSLQAGDILFATLQVQGGSGTTITPPSAFSGSGQLINRTNQSTTVGQATYYKVVTDPAAEPASYTFTFSGAIAANLLLWAYRGLYPEDLVNVVSGNSAGSGTTPKGLSVTTTNKNQILFYVASVFGTITFTAPSGMTERFDTNSVTVAELTLSATGATGDKDGTASGAGGPWVAQLISCNLLPVYEQEGYRFRNDDGSETTATWRQTQDSSDTAAAGDTARLRPIVNVTNNPIQKELKLQYQIDGDDTWMDVEV